MAFTRTSKSFFLSTSSYSSPSPIITKAAFILVNFLCITVLLLPGGCLSLKSCPHPTLIPNGNVNLVPLNTRTDKDGKYPSGSKARVNCDQGYHLKYNQLRYLLCNENGEWISNIEKQPIESICQPDTCGPPSELSHGYYKLDTSPKSLPKTTKSYPLGAILKPACDNSYTLNCTSNQCGRIICEAGGKWKLENQSMTVACMLVPVLPLRVQSQTKDRDYDDDTCGRPPKIYHGYYTIEKNQFKQRTPASESYPANTVLHPACEKSFSLNCSRQCGRIICENDGHWAPKDDKLITACVAEPLLVRSNPHDHSSKDGHGMGSESSIKHYLVLALAVVSVLAVCILTVLILRRPTFCKKQRGTSSGGGGGGGHGQNDVPQIITSSSPASNMDALPLAMNTGIFVPGADYDLQDCHFQHQPIVGTQVFK